LTLAGDYDTNFIVNNVLKFEIPEISGKRGRKYFVCEVESGKK
jgi:hypothetical protein